MATTATSHVPAVGEQAPDFTLAATSGTDVSLHDFRGRKHVLLAFFPLAFTSTCTTEMCAFSEDFDQFATKDVEVLPISVDSVPTLKEFKTKYAMKVDLLSDFKRDVARRYGVLLEDRFYANRAYFLIDKQGVIRWAHVEATPRDRRENREILERVAMLG
jgi:peroxiredoxin